MLIPIRMSRNETENQNTPKPNNLQANHRRPDPRRNVKSAVELEEQETGKRIRKDGNSLFGLFAGASRTAARKENRHYPTVVEGVRAVVDTEFTEKIGEKKAFLKQIQSKNKKRSKQKEAINKYK
ncbi:hypothetical protein [Alkalicoccus chagannorensis]|uniref:hypothetical protein n=1 Tax=Alkalicoccus chagannorensis TaxID=427072 RepID=UPI00040A9697|nr:hypothetical protein [Alkalicoccus chagannorensis]